MDLIVRLFEVQDQEWVRVSVVFYLIGLRVIVFFSCALISCLGDAAQTGELENDLKIPIMVRATGEAGTTRMFLISWDSFTGGIDSRLREVAH